MRPALLLLWASLTACAESSLERKILAAAPSGLAWVTYEVPLQSGSGTICSHWDNGGFSSRQSKLLLDGPRKLRLLFRVNAGKIEKMSLASEDCSVEPGTQSLVSLAGVSPEESIDFLASREDDSSLFALSLHDHPAATPKLIELCKSSANPKRQKKAFFWLARSKDPAALAYIDKILR